MKDKSSFVWRKKGQKYQPDYTAETVKQPLKIMACSIIGGTDTGRLYIVDERMNQVQYKKVLEKRLIP